MLDKTKSHTEAETVEKGLGVGIRFAVAVGKDRQIEMTAGVPLDWGTGQFNETLDKLAATMDRQSLRYQLHDMKDLLFRMERDLATSHQQLINYEQQARDEWDRRGKQGDFRMSGNQTKQAQNFKTTSDHLTTQLKKLRSDIEDVERQCR